jgi:hydroxymethylbilane synthase
MIRIATRGSALALAQSRRIAEAIQRLGETTEIIIKKTTGDAIVDRPFTAIEGKGFFTKELEDALLAGEADVAVHSLKDLPVSLPDGLALAAIPDREDPADLLIIRNECVDWRFSLPLAAGERVGTSSARRRAQWSARRPDTRVAELRGNVTTRIDKLRAGEYGAILLARAGISRLELDLGEFTVVRLDPAIFVPAPGQGALALEIRAGDAALAERLAPLNCKDVRDAVDAERAVLAALGGGCSEPVGAYARRRGRGVVLDVAAGARDGDGRSATGPELRRVHVVADSFEDASRKAISGLFQKANGRQPSLRGKSVAITQQKGRGERLACELEERGARVLMAPLISTQIIADAEARSQIDRAVDYRYILFTSRTAAEAFLEIVNPATRASIRDSGSPVIGAVGRATAEPLEAAGFVVEIVSRGDGASPLADLVIAHAASRSDRYASVLCPCAREPRAELFLRLQEAGMHVTRAFLYETLPATTESLAPLRGEQVDYAIFFSPSAVETFCSVAPFEARACIAVGPTTLASLLAAGISDARASSSPEPSAILNIVK